MNLLYPLKFTPLFKEKVWGGEKIRTLLGLDFVPLENCGEAWVLSGVPGSQTVVSNGFLRGNTLNELVEVYMDELVGEKQFNPDDLHFPILVKFIDSHDWLSIQVHPDDALAAKRRLGNGKTEMWYILDAQRGAELISGFSQRVNQKVFLDHLKENRLKEILNIEQVNRDDVFFIPAGRVHALGPGVLLAEIQQTSDTTYRIYDWDRTDKEGSPRELHAEEALEAIDFGVEKSYRTDFTHAFNETVNLVDCKAFTTNLLDFSGTLSKDFRSLDSFVIYLCIEGACSLHYPEGIETLKKGEVALLPASMEKVFLQPESPCKLLEVYST